MGTCKIDGCNVKRIPHGPGVCAGHLNGRKISIDKIKRAAELLGSAPVPLEGRSAWIDDRIVSLDDV